MVFQIQPAGHWLFQLANTCLLVSYLATNLLALRVLLALASLCFMLWGLLILNALDTGIWNFCFLVINSVQSCLILYKMRPIQFKHKAHELVYTELFQKVGVTRHDFKKLVEVGLIRALKSGSYYVEAGNVMNSLSVVYKGKLEVYKMLDGKRREDLVTMCNVFEFIESPEWAARSYRKQQEHSSGKPGFLAKAGPKIQIVGGGGQGNVGIKAEDFTAATEAGTPGPATENGSLKGGRANVGETEEVEGKYGSLKSTGNVLSKKQAKPAASPSASMTAEMPDAERMGVTVKAVEDCLFISWPLEQLEEFFADNPQLLAPMNALVGADVANKLFQAGGLPNREGRKLREERTMSEDERAVMKLFREKVDEVEATHILRLGKVQRIRREGTIFHRAGEEASTLALLQSGEMEAISETAGEEKVCYVIKPSQFIGAAEYMAGEHVSPVTIRARGPCTLFVWDAQDLRQECTIFSSVANCFNSVLAVDMAARVKTTLESVPDEEEVQAEGGQSDSRL